MIVESVKFRGHRCFKNHWAGFDTVKPVNVIIGRNNTGKTRLLELVDALCEGRLRDQRWSYLLQGAFDESSLKNVFSQRASGGELRGSTNHWEDHGKHFLGASVTWELDANWQIQNLVFQKGFDPSSTFGGNSTNFRLANIRSLLQEVYHKLNGRKFRRLLAERDIHPETAATSLTLGQDGHGATNIVRRYIVTSNPAFPRELIQSDLLNELNGIFAGDGQFDEIQVKHHDEHGPGKSVDHWEIYLGEKGKAV